jgi:hypothetical protein
MNLKASPLVVGQALVGNKERFYYAFQNLGFLRANKPVNETPVWCMLSWLFMHVSSSCVLCLIMAEFESKVNTDVQELTWYF